MKHFVIAHATIVALSCATTGAFAADATTTTNTAANAGVTEIIVTARRREERIQDVPLSITVQTGEALAAQGVESLSNLGRVTPGLTVTTTPRGANSPNFILRGQRTIDTSPVLDPVIVTYFNEVPFMRSQGLNAALFDVQSLQVLRGPQGTLFGRNSTGGAVVVTTTPASSTFGGYGAVSFGDYDLMKGEAALNIPLGERAAIRIAAVSQQRDGYLRNRIDGKDYYDVNFDAQRLTFHWEPIDGLTNDLYASRYYSKDNGAFAELYAFASTATTLPFLAQLQADVDANRDDSLSAASDYPIWELTKTHDVANVTSAKISDAIGFKNIFGFRHVETVSLFDFDGSSAFIQRNVGDTDIDQYSNEFQVLGGGAQFDWLFGLFYFEEEGSDISNQYRGTSPSIRRQSGVELKNTSYSAFASGTYRFGDSGFALSAGVRYTRDERDNNGVQVVGSACGFTLDGGALIAPPCRYHQKIAFEEPSWSLSLNYQPTSALLLYAAHRHGYRSGGLQSRATSESAAVPFQPEEVDDIELGVKYELPGGRGRINADVYRAWYENVQRQIVFFAQNGSGTLVTGLFNAAESTVTGGELETTFVPFDWLELSASAAYTDAKYDTYVNNGVDISSTPYAFVPDWTVNAGVNVKLPIAPALGDFAFDASYRHQAGFYNSDTPQPFGDMDGFDVVDLRLDWDRVLQTATSASLFVSNVFDERYYPFANNVSASSGQVTRSVGAPRMWGVRLRYDF